MSCRTVGWLWMYACLLFSLNVDTGIAQKLGIKGLVTAVFSPFDDGMNLNLSVVSSQASFLVATGVEYAFVGGTTGESVSLTVTERMSLLEQWMGVAEVKNNKLSVIAHVGCNNLFDAVTLAKHAASVGVIAIAAMPPSFFKPATVDALVTTMNYIASAAPNTPFYYYHLPSMTGVDFAMFDFVSAADGIITNLAGVKYTGLYAYPSFMDVTKIVNYSGGKFEVMTGRDEMILSALPLGIVGFVGSQYNFAAELYNALIDAYNSGDIATAQAYAYQTIELLDIEFNVDSGVNGVKAMMNLAGVSVGDARLPSVPVSNDNTQTMKQATAQWCTQYNNPLSWCTQL